MELHELANFPSIRIDHNQGMHWLQINKEGSLMERSELEALANGANMLMQIIRQYLSDIDYITKP